MSSPDVQTLQERIGYRFQNPRVLEEALTHSSTRPQSGWSYERLEFLGDAVLGMTIAEHLFRACPEQDEGELTKMKSCVVCGPVLTRAAQRLGLGEYARVDEGVSARGLPPSLLSDLFEALVGAIYLDGGLEEARRFIFAALEGEIQDVVAGRVASDAKSLLQLHAHRELGCDPLYRILEETGPAHRKQFRAAVNVAGAEYGSDWAATKAAAEQDAAAVALRALGLR